MSTFLKVVEADVDISLARGARALFEASVWYLPLKLSTLLLQHFRSGLPFEDEANYRRVLSSV